MNNQKGKGKQPAQLTEQEVEEQRRTEDSRQRAEEERRRKVEDYKELSERQKRQKDLAEEGKIIIV